MPQKMTKLVTQTTLAEVLAMQEAQEDKKRTNTTRIYSDPRKIAPSHITTV